jgi:prophage DNA circulation protein
MPTNVIPNGETFSFGSLTLHGNLQQLSDSDEQDVAIHRPLKRDGAIVEGMGWNARRFEATVFFVGQNFRAEVVKLRDAIRKKSLDILIHPLHGRVTARCVKIAGALNIPVEANSTTLTLSFVESGIDPKSDVAYGQLPAAKSQALLSSIDDLTTAAALYTSATAAVNNVSAVATDYAEAALDVVQSGTPDPSLPVRLGAIESACAAAIVAIRADEAATEDVDRFDAITAADLVYAAALELADAVAANQAPTMTYTVPAPTSYLSIACILYGVDGLARADEILANNPQVTTPHLIPQGTVLTVAQATV